jgi:DNA-binding transcriptional ArsR family regulator
MAEAPLATDMRPGLADSGVVLAVLADPTRRRILERLRTAEASVGTLSENLGLSQPTTSKHLRVLREAGVVSSVTAAQRRIYRIEPEPLRLLDAWLAPYRQLWTHHLDALERHLDAREDHPESEEK